MSQLSLVMFCAVPNIASTSVSSTTTTTPLSPKPSVAPSSEIDEMTVSPSDGPMVQVNWAIIGVVAAAVAALVVGSVTAAAALIAWRVRRSGQGGERSKGKIMFI